MNSLLNHKLDNERVLIRVDFNVPIENGKIMGDFRIRSALPTIKHCLEGGASVPYIDKLLHFSAFLILTLFMDLSIKRPLPFNKAAVIFLIMYAFFIELVQYFLPYRSAEVFDFVADLLGILVYLYFAPKINIRHTR